MREQLLVAVRSSQRQRLLPPGARPSGVSGERGRSSHAGDGAHVQRVTSVQGGRVECLAQHHQRGLAVDPGPGGGVLVTDRRPQPGAGARARGQVGVQPPGGREVAGVHVAVGSSEEQLDPRWALGGVQLRGPLVQGRGVTVGEAAHRLLGRENQVVDGLLLVPERSGLDVVVRQPGDQSRVVLAPAPLEDLRDPSVVSCAAGGGHPVQHRAPGQRVREPVPAVVGIGDEKTSTDAEVDLPRGPPPSRDRRPAPGPRGRRRRRRRLPARRPEHGPR